MRLATSNWKMILLLLAANILSSILPAILVFLLITQTVGGTLGVQRLYADRLDPAWLLDLINDQFAGISGAGFALQLCATLIVTGMLYLLISTLLSGGIIEILASSDQRFTMRRFWGGCGGYFWRFFRLMWVSTIFYALAIGVYWLLMSRIYKTDSAATVERPTVIKSVAALLLMLLLFSLINMVFDYARIGTAISDRRKMVRETFKAAGFAFRHFVRTFALYLMFGASGLALFAIFVWLRDLVVQDSLGTIFLAVALAQIAIGSRIWMRVACYAGQMDLYQSLLPAPMLVDGVVAGSSATSSGDIATSETAAEPSSETGASQVGA